MDNRMDRDQLIFNALKRAGYHYAVTLPCDILKGLIHRVEDSPDIIRVPLASGLLSGKFSTETRFSPGDHRFFNRNGMMFDRGETFAGVPYDTGLKAVARLKQLFRDEIPLAHVALRWILMREEVGCIIPGASSPDQVRTNLMASELPPLTADQLIAIEEIYKEDIKPLVHQLW